MGPVQIDTRSRGQTAADRWQKVRGTVRVISRLRTESSAGGEEPGSADGEDDPPVVGIMPDGAVDVEGAAPSEDATTGVGGENSAQSGHKVKRKARQSVQLYGVVFVGTISGLFRH